MNVRLQTIKRGRFTIWADRVPVLHGLGQVFTVWEQQGPRHVRRYGGPRVPAKLAAEITTEGTKHA